MSLNWNDILYSIVLPYSKIIESFIFYKIKPRVFTLSDYKKHCENAKNMYKFSLICKKGFITRLIDLKDIFSLLTNRFENKNGCLIKISKENNIHLSLMNMKWGRMSFAMKIWSFQHFVSYSQIFWKYIINDYRNKKSYRLSYIDQILKYFKNKNMDPYQITYNFPRYFKNQEILSKLRNNEYLIHYIAKYNFDIEYFLKIDILNIRFKFKIDNYSNKAYDYYLINKNSRVINDLLDLKIDKDFNRNFFSSSPLIELYFDNSRNMDNVDLDLVIKLLEFDADNEKSNFYTLFQKKKISFDFLKKTGSRFCRQILNLFHQDYFLNNNWVRILNFMFQNNLISNEVFKSSIDETVTYLISTESKSRHFANRENEDKINKRITDNVEILKFIFSDKRFKSDNYINKYFDKFLHTKKFSIYFVSKDHLIKMIKKIYFIERTFSGYKKEYLLNLFFNGLKDLKSNKHFKKRKRESGLSTFTSIKKVSFNKN